MEKREVKNNKVEVPLRHYEELFRNLDPERRAEELSVPYEADGENGGAFSIRMLGSVYHVRWPDAEVTSDDPKAIALANGGARILLLRLLISASDIPASGSMKPFPELPGAAIYTTTYNGRCIKRAAWKFGTDLEEFRRGAEALGGTPAAHGDAGYAFTLIKDYHVELYVYEGDDEFPPNAQFLYSDNFAALTAEDAVVAAETLITAVGAR